MTFGRSRPDPDPYLLWAYEMHQQSAHRIAVVRDAFEAAREAGNWAGAAKAAAELALIAFVGNDGRRHDRHEIAALATELQRYRPHPGSEPPAPGLDDHVYVDVGAWPWTCVARAIRRQVYYAETASTAEHWVADKKTICGRKVNFAISGRYPSGGWPRAREVCPECVAAWGPTWSPSPSCAR